MEYFFDFELSDPRGIPLYLPIRAGAADLDAGFVKECVRKALGARDYTVKQSAGPWAIVSPSQEEFVAKRRAAYETAERPQRTIPCSVIAPPNSKRKIPGPLLATVLDPQRKVEELLAITIEL